MRHDSHAALVASLVERRVVVSDDVRRAFAAVDRAVYVPEAAQAEAYHDAPVILKLDEAGRPVSTVSQPTMVAVMLEQLRLQQGDRVLEVGTASGYNAALLAEIVGERGLVVTVEVDAELAARAGERLAALRNVRAILVDGRLGYAPEAPYNGIVVTAGTSAVEEAWVDQLVVGGRLVVPITGDDGRGHCVTFDRTTDGLVQRDSVPCGFVPLR